jgi:acyl-CoA synthetase (AMP-forming)/AMP-acid ligase II
MYHIYGFVKLVLSPLHRGYSIIVLPVRLLLIVLSISALNLDRLQKFSVKPFCEAVAKYRCTFALVAPPVLVRKPIGPLGDAATDARSLA